MRISSCHLYPRNCRSDCQDMVFILPPGISDGVFQLKIDNIWFCKVLLLFSIDTNTDTGMKTHECAYVSVMEEFKGCRRPGHILHILHILYISHILHILHIMHLTLFDCCTAWLAACQTMPVHHSIQAPRIITSIVCYSSILHIVAPSYFSSGQFLDNTILVVKRIS
jgi:hypothetical protein